MHYEATVDLNVYLRIKVEASSKEEDTEIIEALENESWSIDTRRIIDGIEDIRVDYIFDIDVEDVEEI